MAKVNMAKVNMERDRSNPHGLFSLVPASVPELRLWGTTIDKL